MANQYLTKYLNENFDVQKVTEALIDWIRDWFSKNGPTSPAVIGLSGGKDSTTVATLCVRALGKERVFGVLMPDHIQDDLNVSTAVAKWLGIRYALVDVGSGTDGIREGLRNAKLFQGDQSLENTLTPTPQMNMNIPPRIRMTTLYAIAQTMNGRVSNNCNRSEDHVGYSTIFGDMAGDFSPLSHLTVAEVIAIGEYLNIPEEFIHKKPSDGLSGKTDEDAFGFTYEALDTYILTGICEDPAIREKMEDRHQRNLFKLLPMAAFDPSNNKIS